MAKAYERAGLKEQCSGTHIFRRTVATTMHQRGATLKEVADILGHKSINTVQLLGEKLDLPDAIPVDSEASDLMLVDLLQFLPRDSRTVG